MRVGDAATVEELERDPNPLLRRLRAAEPVAWLPALGAWLVTSRALALQVMRDDATFTVDDPRFSTAQVVGQSMLSLDGAEHDRHRAPFARRFRVHPVRERFTAFVEAECDRLLDAVAADGQADLRQALTAPLAVSAMREALGLQEAEPADVLAWYEAIVSSVSGVSAGRPVSPEGHAAFAALRGSLEATIARGEGTSLLGDAAAGGGLSVAETVSNAAVLLFGGIETTDGMLANAIWHLLSNPGALAEVRAAPELVSAAVEESLRLEPAAAVVDRYATRDTELAGAHLRKGDLVTVSLAGANRDPEVFDDPDRFDLHRPNARLQVAFAHGPHVCVGLHLARLEAQVAVTRVLRRFAGLRLAEPTAPRGLVFRKPPGLVVSWAARVENPSDNGL
jgi:cytochrome P450